MLLGWRCGCCGGTYPKGNNSAKQWAECPYECYNCGSDMFLRVEDDEPEPLKLPYKTPDSDGTKYSWGGDGNLFAADSYFNLESD